MPGPTLVRTSLAALAVVGLAGFASPSWPVAVSHGGQAAAPSSDSAPVAAVGSVRGRVAVKRGIRYKRDRSGIVLYLEGVPDDSPDPLSQPAVIDQTDKTFRPPLTVVPVGSTITFPNNDRVFHNVFSVSRPAQFDLGLYKRGTSKSVTFDRPGVIDIYCNIHPQMAAKVVVLATEHYDVTERDGSFSLDGIPPGTYTLVAWQAHGHRQAAEVRVQAGEPTVVDIELREQRWPDLRHPRKDGTPYGRYQ